MTRPFERSILPKKPAASQSTPAVGSGDGLRVDIERLTESVAALSHSQSEIVGYLNSLQPPPQPNPDPVPPQLSPTQPDVQLSDAGLIHEFTKSIGFEFVGEQPRRPEFGVVFDSDNAGTVQAYFHAVQAVPGYLILIYDHRFQGGFQYIPPDQTRGVVDQNPLRITVLNWQNQQYQVLSVGIRFTLGVLDYIVLPEVGDGENRTDNRQDAGRSEFAGPSESGGFGTGEFGTGEFGTSQFGS